MPVDRFASVRADIQSVFPDEGVLETNFGPIKADVVNFVVPQQAGRIATLAGLSAENGWCPCDTSGASSLNRRAMILGDARDTIGRTLISAEQV